MKNEKEFFGVGGLNSHLPYRPIWSIVIQVAPHVTYPKLNLLYFFLNFKTYPPVNTILLYIIN